MSRAEFYRNTKISLNAALLAKQQLEEQLAKLRPEDPSTKQALKLKQMAETLSENAQKLFANKLEIEKWQNSLKVAPTGGIDAYQTKKTALQASLKQMDRTLDAELAVLQSAETALNDLSREATQTKSKVQERLVAELADYDITLTTRINELVTSIGQLVYEMREMNQNVDGAVKRLQTSYLTPLGLVG